MSSLNQLIALVSFISVIIPSMLLFGGALLAGHRLLVQPEKRVLLYLFGGGVLALGLLNFFIWTNPYGRSLSSTLPGFGMFPVVIVLWTLILWRFPDVIKLWRIYPYLSAVLSLFSLGFFILLGIAEGWTLLIVAGLPVVFSIAGWAARRLSMMILAGFTLILSALIILGSSGTFYTPGEATPTLVASILRIGGGLSIVLSILLSAAMVYTGLRSDGDKESPRMVSQLVWRLFLAVILIVATAYYVFWDGIWSAAHARAFEDHLPFGHLLFGLAAGVFLAIVLKGRRRWAGPAFTLALTAVAVFALSWGWSVSAFKLTNSRASRVTEALGRYFEDHQRYPDQLDELTPRYLLLLPPPVVVRQGDWCYQSSGENYALGYISGEFTYSTSDFRIEQVPGTNLNPAAFPACTELIEAMASGDQTY